MFAMKDSLDGCIINGAKFRIEFLRHHTRDITIKVSPRPTKENDGMHCNRVETYLCKATLTSILNAYPNIQKHIPLFKWHQDELKKHSVKLLLDGALTGLQSWLHSLGTHRELHVRNNAPHYLVNATVSISTVNYLHTFKGRKMTELTNSLALFPQLTSLEWNGSKCWKDSQIEPTRSDAFWKVLCAMAQGTTSGGSSALLTPSNALSVSTIALSKLSVSCLTSGDSELLFAILLSVGMSNYRVLLERLTKAEAARLFLVVESRGSHFWNIPSSYDDEWIDPSIFTFAKRSHVLTLRKLMRRIKCLDLSYSPQLLLPQRHDAPNPTSSLPDDQLFDSQPTSTSTTPPYSTMTDDENDPSLSSFSSEEMEFVEHDESIYHLILQNISWSDLNLGQLEELYLNHSACDYRWNSDHLQAILRHSPNLRCLGLVASKWSSYTDTRETMVLSISMSQLTSIDMSFATFESASILLNDIHRVLRKIVLPNNHSISLNCAQVQFQCDSVVKDVLKSLLASHRSLRTPIRVLTAPCHPDTQDENNPPMLLEPTFKGNTSRDTQLSAGRKKGDLDSCRGLLPTPVEESVTSHSSGTEEDGYREQFKSSAVSSSSVVISKASLCALGGILDDATRLSKATDSIDAMRRVGELLITFMDRRHLAIGTLLNRTELTTLIAWSHGLYYDSISNMAKTYLQILSLACLEEITCRSLSLKMMLLDRWDEDDDTLLGDTDHQVTFVPSDDLRYSCSALEAETLAFAPSQVDEGGSPNKVQEILVIDPRNDAKLRNILSDAQQLFKERVILLKATLPILSTTHNYEDNAAKTEINIDEIAALLIGIKKFVVQKLRNRRKSQSRHSGPTRNRYLGSLGAMGSHHHHAILFKLICDLLDLRCSYHRMYEDDCATDARGQSGRKSTGIWQGTGRKPLHRNFVRFPRLGGRDVIIAVSWDTDESITDKKRRNVAIETREDPVYKFAAVRTLDELQKKLEQKTTMNSRAVKTPTGPEYELMDAPSSQAVDLDQCFRFLGQKGEGSFGKVFAVASRTEERDVVPEPARKKRRVSQIGYQSPNDALCTGYDVAVHPDENDPSGQEPIKKFALKIIDLHDVNDFSAVEDEISILKLFNHPRLVSCYNIFLGYREDTSCQLKKRPSSRKGHRGDASLCCLMELCEGSLEDALRGDITLSGVRESSAISVGNDDCLDISRESWVLPLLLDTCRGMKHLHDPQRGVGNEMILHRDLKPGNILLSLKPNPDNLPLVRAMIADFGVATVRPLKDLRYFREAFSPLTQEPGTHAYMAPEQANSCAYDRPADVFAFGVVLLRILGIPEFTQKKRESELNNLLANLGNTPGDAYIQLLATRCLDDSPYNRPSFPDIVRSLVLEMMSRCEEEGR